MMNKEGPPYQKPDPEPLPLFLYIPSYAFLAAAAQSVSVSVTRSPPHPTRVGTAESLCPTFFLLYKKQISHSQLLNRMLNKDGGDDDGEGDDGDDGYDDGPLWFSSLDDFRPLTFRYHKCAGAVGRLGGGRGGFSRRRVLCAAFPRRVGGWAGGWGSGGGDGPLWFSSLGDFRPLTFRRHKCAGAVERRLGQLQAGGRPHFSACSLCTLLRTPPHPLHTPSTPPSTPPGA
jgi:hypothetical protein